MFDFPIAERELRVAARSSATYRSRWNIAGIVLLVFIALYWNFGKLGGWATAKIFFLLSGLCFLYTLFAGLILTADCISSEKRDGTLGLLFLTALKPSDLVAGNILATSLKAFFGLLAAFPILGLSLLLGGVEYLEFARICLTLISTLIFSLSLSLFVSCVSDRHLVATGRAAFVLTFFALILPVFCDTMRRVSAAPPRWVEMVSLVSPSKTLELASSGWIIRGNDFWWSLLYLNLMSALFLLSACFVLPHVWKEHGIPTGKGLCFIPFGFGPRLFRFFHRELRETNPFLWLASRRSSEPAKFLSFALLLFIAGVLATRLNLSPFVGRRFAEFAAPIFVWSWVLAALHALLLFKFAMLACDRFSEDRKLGALELFLVTPVTVRQLLWGQWLALLRQLGGPILAVLFLHGLIFWAFLTFAGMDEGIRGGASAVFQTLLRDLRSDDANFWMVSCICAIILGSALILFLDWVALGWVGMWVALRTPRPALAPWIALALVLLPPVPIFGGAVSLGVWLGLARGDGSYWAWFCVLFAFGLGLVNALVLIIWCGFQVVRRFRTLAADRFAKRSEHPFAASVRIALRLASSVAVLAILVLLLYGEEKWRGLRAWHHLESDYAAKGEMILKRISPPPPVPDAENFGAGDILKPLFDYQFDRFGQVQWRDKAAREALMTLSLTGEERYPWRPNTNEPAANWSLQKPIDLNAWQQFYRTNAIFSSLCATGAPAATVLQALALFDPELTQLDAISRRPLCRFPLHYEEGFTAVWSHLTVLNNVADILQLRSVSRLAQDDIPGARSDIEFAFRLANSVNSGYGLYTFRVRRLILLSALQSIWEGLARHAWRNDDLKFFAQQLQIDLVAAYPRAVREDITSTVDFWERFTAPDDTLLLRLGGFPASAAAARLFPAGWKLLNEVALFRLCDDVLLPIVDPKSHRVFPSRAAGLTRAIRNSRVAIDPVSRDMVPYQNQAFPDAAIETPHCQASIEEALIACALEQWRLANGHFPETLEVLAPHYLDKIPNDIITGTPYKYRLLPDGRFVLYSVGWNETDDSGRSSIQSQSPLVQNLRDGDWSWQYPEAQQPAKGSTPDP